MNTKKSSNANSRRKPRIQPKQPAANRRTLREQIVDALWDECFQGDNSTFTAAKVLVEIAFNLLDWNGGVEDTKHAAKRVREFVGEFVSSRCSGQSTTKRRIHRR